MATVELRGIAKSFGAAKVLHGIDLAIADREFVVFVGPSGCGKSTLLRIIAGLDDATEGAVVIDGQDVSAAPPVARGISMVFQSYALYPHLSVYENIGFPLRVQGRPEADVRGRVERAADILQLRDKLDLRPGQLSGGQRQRVAIGRSIVREPKVFLFDEPLSNLDAALRGDMRVELAQLHDRLDATMIYVTHDQVEAMTMADRIVVLNAGRVEQVGAPMELYHQPATRFVATFIGQPTMNLLPAAIVAADGQSATVAPDGGGTVTLPVVATRVAPGARVELGLRPEHLRLADGSAPLQMQVEVVERLGGVSITYGQVAGHRVCAALPGDAGIARGDRIGLTFQPRDAHLFTADGRACRRLGAPEVAR